MNGDHTALLDATAASMEAHATTSPHGVVHVGVDLGTAYTVVVVLDESGQPLAGASEYAEVVRDGVVVDFSGASALVRRLKEDVESRIGRTLEYAATTYPPGIPLSEVRATRYVLEAAGLDVSALVDEPTAANAVLGLRDGAVVDVGGGTTGTAIVRDGRVVTTKDDATGGHHLSHLGGARHTTRQDEQRGPRVPRSHGGLTSPDTTSNRSCSWVGRVPFTASPT